MARFLQSAPDFEIAGEAGDGESALKTAAELHPEVVFLDVQMPAMDGFEVATSLRAPLPEIVFVTAHDRFALKAFEVHALDYLLKPYDEDRFQKVLDRIRDRRMRAGGAELAERMRKLLAEMRHPDRVVVEQNGRRIFIPLAEVDWMEAARNYIVLHVGAKTYTMRATLESLAKKLDPAAFARVNRSTIVQLDSIRELQPWFHGEHKIVLKDGTTLTWSRSFPASLPARILR